MVYDETLANRLRTVLQGEAGLSERKAFGGLSFLINGNMSVGVIGEDMVVRVGPDGFADALANDHVRPFDFSGRPMKGWVYVAATGLTADKDLERWAQRGVEFARSLPAK